MAYRYMNEPLPKLELDKKRFRVKHCPCGKSNKDGKFVPYVGHENKGYCHGCGQTFLPELKSNDESWKFTTTNQPVKKQPEKILPASFIPVTIFKESLKHHTQNSFIKYLIRLFGSEITGKLISKYFIGSSKHWQGANVFWQIDITGRIRTGKIMLYDSTTGKRTKEPYNHIDWTHNVLKLPEYELRQCFFGEHLLRDNTKSIAICESEKTAIIASVYRPQFIWLACGSKDGLNDKCKVLAGRTVTPVTLFPDLNGFELWSQKAKELSHIARFTVSDLLERKAEQYAKENNIDLVKLKKEGFDLADFLIKYSYKDFILPETALPPVQSNKPVTALQNDLLNIHSNDILNCPIPNFLGREFNQSAILTAITTTGAIEILLDKDGELLQPENEQLVTSISTFFDKPFQVGTLDGQPCLIHSHIVNNNKKTITCHFKKVIQETVQADRKAVRTRPAKV